MGIEFGSKNNPERDRAGRNKEVNPEATNADNAPKTRRKDPWADLKGKSLPDAAESAGNESRSPSHASSKPSSEPTRMPIPPSQRDESVWDPRPKN